jgi:hypothetical protein
MIMDGLLIQAMTHIAEHPDEWDQTQWLCQTKACLAGRICLLAGATPAPHRAEAGALSSTVEYHGQYISAPELAQLLTGLTDSEAHWLWNADRSIHELYGTVSRIALDCAPTWWYPPSDDAIGVMYRTPDHQPVLGVHRRTVFIHHAGHWERRDHPTRSLARDWTAERARRNGFTPTTSTGSKEARV